MNDDLIRHLLRGTADELTVLACMQENLHLPNASGMTAAMAAVINSTPEVLQLLFTKGARATDELLTFAERHYPHKPEMRAVILEALMTERIGDTPDGGASGAPTRHRRQRL